MCVLIAHAYLSKLILYSLWDQEYIFGTIELFLSQPRRVFQANSYFGSNESDENRSQTPKMINSRRFEKFIGNRIVRHYRKKVLDPSHIEEIPVVTLPSKSPDKTSLYVWGLGEHGALGHYIQKKLNKIYRSDARFRESHNPYRHAFGEHYHVKDIAAGFGFSAFSVRTSGPNKVWGTGINTDSQIGFHVVRKDSPLGIILSPVPVNLGIKDPKNTKVISLSAGRAHLVVATDKEGVFTLGNNAYGQCGRTVIDNEKYSGSRIVHKISCIGEETVKSVECGQDHTFFLTESGKIYSCGWGADGQTGLGHYNNQPHPSRVLGDIKGEKIVKISSKSDCVLAINDKGDVFGWGNSEYSQLLEKSDAVQQVNRPIYLKKCQGFGKIVDVAAAGSFCLMLNEEGEVFSWGYGILGRGPSVTQSWLPERIPPILFGKNDFQPMCKVKGIFCGLNYSAAINTYGHVFTWGKNKSYCLGLGHKHDQFFPLRVFLSASATKLALGVDHTLALCHPL